MTDTLEIRTARAMTTLLAAPADQLMCRLVEDFGPVQALGLAHGMAESQQGETPSRWAKYSLATLEALANDLLAEEGIRFIIPEDPEWPEQLNALRTERPYGLWVRGTGSFPALNEAVTITGSRDATEYGRTITTELASSLASHGMTIVAGGGYGVEATALQTTNTEKRPAVTVMAGGLGKLYPVGNADILERSLEHGGLLVSESPHGTTPTRNLFQARHRLLAAFSAVTLVAEARYNSRAVEVAQIARGLGRQVGAVPGSVFSANSAGAHRLIREGVATLTTDAAEAIELINPKQRAKTEGVQILTGTVDDHIAKTLGRKVEAANAHAGLEVLDLVVLAALPVRDTRDLDQLAIITDLALAPLSDSLTGLTERGLARQVANGYQRVQL